jgi:L-aminopeptidase/D-esterase-like protein
MKGLTDIPGILVGHATDTTGVTGCTAILCPEGAVAGYDLRGSATGTVELETMAPDHVASHVHAICLAGGSAFGLAASGGVRDFLEEKGIGYDTGSAIVPIVPGAILYDLAVGDSKARPDRKMGYAAAAAASNAPVEEGSVGVGAGATVGKFHGIAQSTKSGIGSFTVRLAGPWEGIAVSALAAVNAYGDIRDPNTGEITAGARLSPDSAEFADTERLMLSSAGAGRVGENTTLVVIATNASLSRVEAAKLAQLASAGVAHAVRPAWTTVDGDITIALSTGGTPAPVNNLGVAAARAVSQAILRAVRRPPREAAR